MGVTYNKSELRVKAEEFCNKNDTIIAREIGFGTQGVVYQTMHNTAIKAYHLEEGYKREKGIYTRLKERNIQSVFI